MHRWSCALLVPGICLLLGGCSREAKTPIPDVIQNESVQNKPVKMPLPLLAGGPKQGVSPDDASVVYDEPFMMVSKAWTYNGKAYDKACLWVDPKIKLVLPVEALKVVSKNDANAVFVYMQKSMRHHSHGDKSWFPIERYRSKMGCAVKLEKGYLLIGTYGESSYLEGANTIRLVVHVPAQLEVSTRTGLVGGMEGRAGSERPPGLINPDPNDPKPALTKKHSGRPECWLPPTAEDGWHEIPAIPDKERRVEKENPQ